MDNLLQVILLGVVEGITEFLPISSTGHLLIAEHWLGARSDLFNIAIQAGAIVAVVLIYWRRLLELGLGIAQPANRDYALKLALSFLLTCVGGLTAKHLGLKLPETVTPVAWALIAGGAAIFAIERFVAGRPESATPTWTVAVAVGLAQVLAAVFPGTSRSAATIFAAMLAGMTSRPAAAEFSFLLGIPTMFAAAALEALEAMHDGVHEPLDALAVGFVVSAVVAFAAVKWLLYFIKNHRFTAFAWYRVAVGAALLALT